MKNKMLILTSGIYMTLMLYQCGGKESADADQAAPAPMVGVAYGGFESQLKWGEHLVIVSACHDCHTPKKMTPAGPVLDSTRFLSGHPAEMPKIDVDRKEMESKGLAVTMDLTEWIGPWGISYTANLTPDETGIGSWTEEQFIRALREGKYKGLESSRPLLPPMPWEMYRNMTDDELKAIFAYLKSIKPVHNIVPAPVPPTNAG